MVERDGPSPPLEFADGVGAAVSGVLLSGSNVLDAIFSHVPPPPPSDRSFSPLGSGVYLRQTELLRRLSGRASRDSVQIFPAGDTAAAKKLYRGVRQRHRGKWVAEIRLPQNRMRVWLGTYDSPESAAIAYDRASYKLRGEYARLNFPDLNGAGVHGLRDLRSAVDAKIQAICQRIGRQRRARRERAKEKKIAISEAPIHLNEIVTVQSTRSDGSSDSTRSSSSGTGEMMDGECSLARLPSFDPEIIWSVLAN